MKPPPRPAPKPIDGSLPPAPKKPFWTTAKPTKPGWYWYFDRTETYRPLRPLIFEVQHLPSGKLAIMTHLNLWGGTEDYRYVEDLDGQFAGPLEAPQ